MTPTNIDPDEQAFVQRALEAVDRAQRWEKARLIGTASFALLAAAWFATRPSGPELGIEATIIIMTGAMIGVVTAKLRSLIQHNTRLILHAIAGLRADPVSRRPDRM